MTVTTEHEPKAVAKGRPEWVVTWTMVGQTVVEAGSEDQALDVFRSFRGRVAGDGDDPEPLSVERA
jgi:hypothetical protein